MPELWLALIAYGLGFAAAIPIGATQVEIAKRSLANHRGTAAMVVLGSVLSDVMYGAIAIFGLAPYFRHRIVVGVFGLVGTVILVVLAAITLHQRARGVTLEDGGPAIRSLWLSFVTGFSLAVTNPPMIFWWLVGAKIATDPALGIISAFTPRLSLLFLLAGGAGIGSYLLLLTFVVHRIKHMITPHTSRRIQLVMAVLLLGLAAFMLVGSIRDLSH